jgi:hypothetical protein
MAATIVALVPLIEDLEPEVQAGVIALIHKLHKKQLSAQDYINLAQTLISSEQAAPPAPAP